MTNGFFDNKTVVSEDFATFVRGILTNGVTGDTADVLKVSAAGGMYVNVAPGYAWINGHFGKVEVPEILTISTASGSMARIDRVVVRLDMNAATVSLAILTGTAAAAPTAPVLTRDGTIHELCLANISVAAGATAITSADITDTRADSTLCGAVLANTKETLALSGKADQTALEALEESLSAEITKLYARKLTAKELINEPINGTITASETTATGTAVLSAAMAGYGIIRLTGTVTMRNIVTSTSGGTSTTDEAAEYEFSVMGIGDNQVKEITIKAAEQSDEALSGGTAAWKAAITQTTTGSGITIYAEATSPESSTTNRYIISALTIDTARAVYIT